MLQKKELENSAALFANYLVGHDPSPAQIQLYAKTLPRINSTQTKTLHYVLEHPKLVRFFDGYDGVFHHNSALRQHIHTMFAILESSPKDTSLFLPIARPWYYIFVIIFHGIIGVFSVLIGLIVAVLRGLK